MKKIFAVSFLFLFYGACKEKLPIVNDWGRTQYQLVDQNGKAKVFPDLAKEKTTIVGYIFTNCPDICPLTTNNMRLIQEQLKKENIVDVNFVSITFDPEHDEPAVLRNFAEIRNLDLSNWTFLTGKRSTIDSIIQRAGVMAVVGDSTIFKDGRRIYYYIHTDRIQLIDSEGRIRKNYTGSKINIDEITLDIKELTN